jgi:flagellar protein FliO/FliZ
VVNVIDVINVVGSRVMRYRIPAMQLAVQGWLGVRNLAVVIALGGAACVSVQASTDTAPLAGEPLVALPIELAAPDPQASLAADQPADSTGLASQPEPTARISPGGLRLKEDVSEQARPVAGQSIMQMLGGLLAVLALFVAFVWVMRQLQGKLPGTSTRMRIESTLALGNREKLVIVSVDQQRLLLGVTAQQITCLQPLPADDSQSERATEFSQRMQALLKGEAKDA